MVSAFFIPEQNVISVMSIRSIGYADDPPEGPFAKIGNSDITFIFERLPIKLRGFVSEALCIMKIVPFILMPFEF